MAKEIIAWCDVCLSNDVKSVGDTITVSLDGAKTRAVDICAEHHKELVEPLHDLLVEHGQPIEVRASKGAPLECTECGREYTNPGSLAKHRQKYHRDQQLPTLRDESALRHQCPDCDRAFETPQGLGAHRNRSHGYTSPSKQKQSDE